MISGLFQRVPGSQTNIIYLWIDQDTSKIKKNPKRKQTNSIFINLKILELQHVANFRKDGRRTMMKMRVTNLGNLGYEINIYKKHEMDVW